MRRTLTAVISAVILSLACAAGAHAQAAREAAAKELIAGVRAYRDGRFAEAEQHFRRVSELDPAQRNAPLFIARAVQQQYKPGDASPENLAAGERAVAAYQVILARDPQNEDAYKAVVFLYGRMKRDDKVLEMLTARANDFMVPNADRAQAFVILASKKWQCSYDVTGSEEEWAKASMRGPRLPSIDAGDLVGARQCVDEGAGLIEQAVLLDPDGPGVWTYKALLLREESKLAEAEGDAARKADYDRQYDEALDTQKRATAEAQRKARAGQKVSAPDAMPEPVSTPEPAPTPAPPPDPA